MMEVGAEEGELPFFLLFTSQTVFVEPMTGRFLTRQFYFATPSSCFPFFWTSW